MLYLIVQCNPLSDQWECDADRIPKKIVADKREAFKYSEGYEVWAIDGKTGNVIKCIKDYCE